MQDLLATLIMHGFYDAEEYGYSFIKACQRAIEQNNKMQIAAISAGIGLLFSKPADQRKFFEN